jgi:protein-disulfide isomerase
LADGSGIALAALALGGSSKQLRSATVSTVSRPIWFGVAIVMMSAPLLWAVWKREIPASQIAVPDEVKAFWVDGRITVVEVTDFDCPHCARADRVLKEALRDATNIHFVRLAAPMPNHANARPAARAYVAAQQQGKGDEMATALYAAESRSADACREIAERLGLTMADYDRVVADRNTDAKLDATIAWARRAGSLPLICIQDRGFARVPTADEIRDALRAAAARFAK